MKAAVLDWLDAKRWFFACGSLGAFYRGEMLQAIYWLLLMIAVPSFTAILRGDRDA